MKRVKVRLVNNAKKWVSRTNFVSQKIFNGNFFAVF